MAKKFKQSEVESLHKAGYKPRIVRGEVVCDIEPPDGFVPEKKESIKQEIDKKADK